MGENIGFISTRFAGTDGVSLESAKWAEVLAEQGNKCFWYAGKLDRKPSYSMCIPEAFFGHPENTWIDERIWGRTTRDPLVTQRIYAMADYLKTTLYHFIRKYHIGILIPQNALSIPMHIPLGIALTSLISETGLPAIAHHHDFAWERTRYSITGVKDLLDMAFPPRSDSIQHVVINNQAQEELSRRKAVNSLLIPNVLDFETPPPATDCYASDIREAIGLSKDDVMILQPTRIVPRKGIGHAINLVQMLGDPKYKLVISHEAGDEGVDYLEMLQGFAQRSNVDLRFFATRVADTRLTNNSGEKMYTLWDLYPHADFVTYPSFYEGFGNAFLEALYFKKPILVNRYDVFTSDIEPRGFKVPVMDGFLTKAIVREVKRIIEDDDYRREMVDHNYETAKKFYSYDVLRRRLKTLMINIRGLSY